MDVESLSNHIRRLGKTDFDRIMGYKLKSTF